MNMEEAYDTSDWTDVDEHETPTVDPSRQEAPKIPTPSVPKAAGRVMYGRRGAIAAPRPARTYNNVSRSRESAPFSGYPALSAHVAASASQQVVNSLPPPTPKLDFLGDEIPPEDRNIRKQESIDQSKYPVTARLIETEGWLPLIKAAYEDEQVAESTLSKRFDLYNWTRECDEALAGINAKVLEACMTGNPAQLAAQDRADGELKNALREYHTRSEHHPSIYVRSLAVGPKHDNLTVEEAMRVALVARQYANMQSDKWEEARTIDKHLYGKSWRSAWSQQGYRALIHNRKAKVDSMKQCIMQTWADALERVAREAEAKKQTHIKTLYYVGYSIDAVKRKQDHEKMDHSTNDLVRFVEAVLATSSWFTNTPVRFWTNAICLLSGEDVAACAEALVARALGSYHFSAGFNIQACGASVHSVYGQTLSPTEEEEKWVECREWLHNNTDYSKYRVKETERRRALQKKSWKEESGELLRKHEEGQQRRRKLRDARDAVQKEIDWEIMHGDPFFAEYIEMFKRIGDVVD